MVVLERAAVALRIEIVAQTRQAAFQRAGVGRRVAVEPGEVREHRPESGAHQVAPLGEEAEDIVAPVFQRPVLEADRETHVGGLGRNAQVIEQGHEIGIVRFVVDDEAHVHRCRSRRRGCIRREAVPAQPVSGLVERDAVALG